VERAKGVMYRFHGSPIHTERVFNTLVKACARSTRPLRAAEILEEMLAAGVAPSRTTYNTLLAAAAAGARTDLCWLLVEHMQRRSQEEGDDSLAPDLCSWTALITSETRAVAAEGKLAADTASGKAAGLDDVLRRMPLPHLETSHWAQLLQVCDVHLQHCLTSCAALRWRGDGGMA